ncbi:MAG: hypothetical protein U0324_19435 [Polyangiales bacterium]
MRANVTPSTNARRGLAASVALAPAAYQLARAFGERLAPEAPPDAVLWAARSAFLDRVRVTGFLVVVAAVFFVPWFARRPEVGRRAVRVLVLVGAVVGAVGGALHR